MPAFSTWGPSTQYSRLPLTPPYHATYQSPADMTNDQYYNHHGFNNRHSQAGRDFIHRYAQAPAYQTQQALSADMENRMMALPLFMMLPNFQPTHRRSQHVFLCSNRPSAYAASHSCAGKFIRVVLCSSSCRAKAKEDKPNGGVAAHLDYEMDVMANFVAEMAQRLYVHQTAMSSSFIPNHDHRVSVNASPTSQFRKYVSQILASTRLPSSTIMLGLFYLSRRMKMVAVNGDDTSSSGAVYRMLTTCLLLGSKFLDDNTFQNRSWAEVSSIPVQELNMMELQWLKGFNWELHEPMWQESEGFFTWYKH